MEISSYQQGEIPEEGRTVKKKGKWLLPRGNNRIHLSLRLNWQLRHNFLRPKKNRHRIVPSCLKNCLKMFFSNPATKNFVRNVFFFDVVFIVLPLSHSDPFEG